MTELPAYRLPAEAALEAAGVARERGLDEREVAARRRRFGPNRLRRIRRRGALRILLDQYASLLVALLAAAAALSFAFGRAAETVGIVAVLVLNGAIGFASELRAVRSMEALRALGTVRCRVRREGRVRTVGAEELVPGDLVELEGGDVVSADLRLVEASKLQADESALTGESLPVSKQVAAIEGEAPLAERRNMLWKGTSVTRGAALGVVVGTGMQTELGRISKLVESAEKESTPLERRLDKLGQRLIWVTLLVSAGVAAASLAGGQDWLLSVETAIALAVATVPEGLPIIATLALARGMQRMARRNALVNRLSAVEALGATDVIFSDKTGTLTENRMTVQELDLASGLVEVVEAGFERDGKRVEPGGDAALARAIEVGVLCNDASLDEEGGGSGDPLEVALLVAGRKAGLSRPALLRDAPEEREVAFDPAVRKMATVHRADGGHLVAVKGGPEAVLQVCTRVATPEGERPLDEAARRSWQARNEAMAGRGLRVLALAYRRAHSADEEPYRDLVWLGLVGLLDPPRAEVREALAACRLAGIRVVMVTGDQAPTARHIAHAVGLVEDADAPVVQGRAFETAPPDARIFARVSPEQKLTLIAREQERGAIVAMTGDGVNDAPALRKADVGVAMGRRGTEVARQAADIVLRDDSFGTIVAAIEQGRVIFGNIRRFVVYLLSCNLSEILVVGLATAGGGLLPILPLQILFLNLVTDVFPALALGAGEGDPELMARPPRAPHEGLVERRHWLSIVLGGVAITAAVLGALWMALAGLGLGEGQAVTVSFLTLAFAQLWHVFDMRSPRSGRLRNEITANPWVWAALALCTILLLAAVHLPPLADVLSVEPIDGRAWLLVAAASLAPVLLVQGLQATGLGRRHEAVPDGGSAGTDDASATG